MIKYAKVINYETKLCEVGTGTNKEFYQAVGMIKMDVEQAYNGLWYLSGYAPEKPAPTTEETLKDYEDAVQKHLDKTAQSRDYDNTYTCLSYLSSTDEVWRRESNAFNAWRDSVWRKCHEVMNAALEGAIQPPTVEELIAMLPKINWGE